MNTWMTCSTCAPAHPYTPAQPRVDAAPPTRATFRWPLTRRGGSLGDAIGALFSMGFFAVFSAACPTPMDRQPPQAQVRSWQTPRPPAPTPAGVAAPKKPSRDATRRARATLDRCEGATAIVQSSCHPADPPSALSLPTRVVGGCREGEALKLSVTPTHKGQRLPAAPPGATRTTLTRQGELWQVGGQKPRLLALPACLTPSGATIVRLTIEPTPTVTTQRREHSAALLRRLLSSHDLDLPREL